MSSTTSSSSDGVTASYSDIINSLLRKGDPALKEKLYQDIRNGIEETSKVKDNSVAVVLPWSVSQADLTTLNNIFPSVEIRIANGALCVASLFRVVTYIAFDLMTRSCFWVNDFVIHVDGDVSSTVLRAQEYIHVCYSNATAAMAADRVAHGATVRSIVASGRVSSAMARLVAKQFSVNNMYCCNEALECTRSANTIWVNHLRTNIPMVQVAQLLHKHGATRALGLVPYDFTMLDADEGALGNSGGRFIIDRKSGLMDIFDTAGESPVTMHYQSWLQIVTECAIKVGGVVYTWERIAYHSGFIVYRMVRQKEIPEMVTNYRFSLHRYDNTPRTVIKYWTLRRGAQSGDRLGGWESKSIVWPTELFNKVMIKAADIVEGKYNDRALVQFARDHCNTVVISGASVQTPSDRPTVQELELGCVAIYVHCYKTRYDNAIATKLMTDAVKVNANTDGKSIMRLLGVVAADTVGRLWSQVESTWFGEYIGGLAAEKLLPEFSDLELEREFRYSFPIEGPPEYDYGKWEKTLNRRYPLPPHVIEDGLSRRIRNISAWASGNSNQSKFLAAIKRRVEKPKVSYGNSSGAAVDKSMPGPSSVGLGIAAGLKLYQNVSSKLPANPVPGIHTAVLEKLADAYDLKTRDTTRVVDVVELDPNVTVDEKSDSVETVGDVVGTLQEVHYQNHPEAINNDEAQKTRVVHASDLDISIQATTNVLNVSKMEAPKSKPQVNSKLFTMAGADRPCTFTEEAIAVNKRNNNAPRMREDMDPEGVSSDIRDYVYRKSGFAAKGLEEKLKMYKEQPLTFSVDDATRWILKASPQTLKQIMTCDLSCSDQVLDTYNLIIKQTPKPKLEGDGNAEYPALQTVVFHQKAVNALFSPMFMEVTKRIQSIFQPNVVINIAKSVPDLSAKARTYLRSYIGKSKEFLEVDFRMVDKAQDAIALRLETDIYKDMGVPENIAEMWAMANRLGWAQSAAVGVFMEMQHQRKSGTATTALGNTLVTMFSVIWGYKLDYSNVIVAFFLGDDSLVALKHSIGELVEGTRLLETVMNLAAKALTQTVGYFCSMYLVENGDDVQFMSDPDKRIAMLGRPVPIKTIDGRMQTLNEVLTARYESFRDLLYNYDSTSWLEALDKCVRTRWVNYGSMLRGLRGLVTCAKSKDVFFSLYEDKISYSIEC
jgi:hypothetical protein